MTGVTDPGNAAEDPARRPGQPGAQRQDPPAAPAASPVSPTPPAPGEEDERQIPLDTINRHHRSDADDKRPADEAPLSDGSVRAGPP